MTITNDYEEQAKLAALDAAVRLQSLYLEMPLIVGINDIPKRIDFNLDDWIKLTQNTDIALVNNSKENVEIPDVSDIVIQRANTIYQWLTDKPKTAKD